MNPSGRFHLRTVVGLKVICFLRELDIPIDAVSKILKEEHPENVIGLLSAPALFPIAIVGWEAISFLITHT